MIETCFGTAKNLKRQNSMYKDMRVFGFDTETPAYTIKLLSIGDREYAKVFDVTAETILDTFLNFFRPIKEKEIVCFAHNLAYDFLVLMNQDLTFEVKDCQFLKQECNWKYGDVSIRYFNENPHFGEIRFDEGKRIYLRDTFAFFGRIKLSTLSESLKIGHKLKVDNDDFYRAGVERIRKFREYAKEDARLTAAIGCKIMEFHAMEDISLCVSGPQMAMKVFRKKYIPWEKDLINADREQMNAFELSYHGGMNGCYRAVPTEIHNVNLFDINSAYPHAMTQIPSFLNCDYQARERGSVSDNYEGIYQISCLSNCDFNSTFSHSFTPQKRLDKVWITSYELKSLIEHKCFKWLKVHGSVLVIPNETYNPLGEYAKEYYKLKSETPKSSALYIYYKVCMLNSLYGKFIERRWNEEKGYSVRGSNFNPAIASLITGHTRAYMHRLEHEADAIHCATDSVFTTKSLNTSKGLGGLSSEGMGGILQLFRTKLYIYRDGRTGKMTKNARHGFHGKFETLKGSQGEKLTGLEEMWNNKQNSYQYQKMITASEFFLHKKLNLKLFGLNVLKAKINIDWDLLSVIQ